MHALAVRAMTSRDNTLILPARRPRNLDATLVLQSSAGNFHLVGFRRQQRQESGVQGLLVRMDVGAVLVGAGRVHAGPGVERGPGELIAVFVEEIVLGGSVLEALGEE